jgi:hypothetical protein
LDVDGGGCPAGALADLSAAIGALPVYSGGAVRVFAGAAGECDRPPASGKALAHRGAGFGLRAGGGLVVLGATQIGSRVVQQANLLAQTFPNTFRGWEAAFQDKVPDSMKDRHQHPRE